MCGIYSKPHKRTHYWMLAQRSILEALIPYGSIHTSHCTIIAGNWLHMDDNAHTHMLCTHACNARLPYLKSTSTTAHKLYIYAPYFQDTQFSLGRLKLFNDARDHEFHAQLYSICVQLTPEVVRRHKILHSTYVHVCAVCHTTLMVVQLTF